MNLAICLPIILMVLVTTGCENFQSYVGDFIIGWNTCEEYDQYSKDYQFLVKAAEQLKIEGKITSEELIKIDQDAALNSKEFKTACTAFYRKLITWDQYQAAVAKAHARYIESRKLVIKS